MEGLIEVIGSSNIGPIDGKMEKQNFIDLKYADLERAIEFISNIYMPIIRNSSWDTSIILKATLTIPHRPERKLAAYLHKEAYRDVSGEQWNRDQIQNLVTSLYRHAELDNKEASDK